MKRLILRSVALVAMFVVTSLAPAAVKGSEIFDQREAWSATNDALAVAAAIWQYQTPAGGWPKNVDMSAPPSAEFLANRKFDHRAPTIDNQARRRERDRLHSPLPGTARWPTPLTHRFFFPCRSSVSNTA